MKRYAFFLLSLLLCLSLAAQNEDSKLTFRLLPANNATNVNPDTHLELIFSGIPALGNKGQIRVYDATDNRLVDMLDISIPPGPTESVDHGASIPPYTQVPYEYVSTNYTNANTKPGTPSGTALPNPDTFQLNIIGRFTDAFHFYPLIIHDSIATIYLHNNILEYNRSYYVQIDSGVLTLNNDSFKGIDGKSKWTFTTKPSPPPANSNWLLVDCNGSGDFNTVQGAVDFIPDFNPNRVTVFINNGRYEEIVYFRNKTNITFLGEDREKTVVFYRNNEVFNPHPVNVSTNEWPGTFPSRRAAFMADNSSGIHLVNLTIKTTAKGQAEGLLLMGKENIVSNVNIAGSGDALQANGSVYLANCKLEGDGDTYLGRGPVFFDKCEIYSKGTYLWIRNTNANHGAILLNCKLQTPDGGETDFARAPANHGRSYPYCEAVLINCSLEGIKPIGWGEIGGDVSNVHWWEYNSTNINDGKLVDVSQRHPVSRQLTKEKDADIIANYSNPTFVFDGWTPAMAPLILSQPKSIKVAKGQTATLYVKIAAIPEPSYQWYKNGKAIKGATEAKYVVNNVSPADAASYTVTINNNSGSIISQAATVVVN